MKQIALIIGYIFMVVGSLSALAWVCFYLPSSVWYKVSPRYNAKVRQILSLGQKEYMKLPKEKRKGWKL